MADNWVELVVAEAKSRDVIRGKVRINNDAMRKIGINTGDIVEIQGKKTTAAIAWPAYPEDNIRSIIRMDSIIRKNAGVSIQDKVKIRKAGVKEAKRVIFAPGEINLPTKDYGFIKFVKRKLSGFPLTKGDTIMIPVLGRANPFMVVEIVPEGIVKITEQTEIEITDKLANEFSNPNNISYEDIGGLQDILQKIREMVELPLKHPILFETLGIEPPKGVLIHGPPGVGKTLIAKAVAHETKAHFITINGPEVMSKYYGESEKKLRQIFKRAEDNAPSIIFLDEIDALAPSRESTTGEVERRVVAQLLALMDGMSGRNKTIVIGATNRINAVDPALRRPGRFDREIEISVPNVEGRLHILQIHTRGMPLADDVDLHKYASISHGMVGADLKALAREAAMRTLRRFLPRIDLDQDIIPAEILDEMQVTDQDFLDASKEVQPSALREVYITVPNVTYDQIGGLRDIILEMQETVEWPIKYPDAFERIGITPPGGILLYGPPGTGKTLLAKAVANESEANFISIKGPELLSKWVGESEKGIREIFRKARLANPAIIFFDEIDSIAPRRGMGMESGVTERVISQLLTEIDGLEPLNNVVVIASTNRPDILDPALLRPGRFDRLVYVKPPDVEGRREILGIYTEKMPLASDVNLELISRELDGFVGADIEALCREAALNALREDIDAKVVEHRHFMDAKSKVHATFTSAAQEYYDKIELEIKRDSIKDTQRTSDFT